MEKEKSIQTDILLKFGKHPNFRLWRNQVGTGYGMYIVQNAMKLLMGKRMSEALSLLKKSQPIKWGLKGQSDIFGIHITGRFISIEVKRSGNIAGETDEQRRWGSMVMRFGGVYLCVDSVAHIEEAFRELGLLEVVAPKTMWTSEEINKL